MPTISYAITACNEHNELKRLIEQILVHKRKEDEIVVQVDQDNVTDEVVAILKAYSTDISNIIKFPLNKDFAAFKNNIKSYCKKDYIFFIDADEYLREEFIQHLPEILQDNPTIDLFLLPRINTVEGLTEAHVQKWRWRVDEKGWVNFPDYQTRILQNSPEINWVNKVHEVLTGHNTHALFPAEEFYCLIHPKTIDRQEKQNTLYSVL